MVSKIKINSFSVIKDVEENSIERPFKNMSKPVNWSSCPKENNSILKPKDSLRINK